MKNQSPQNDLWFEEIFKAAGTRFGLQVDAKLESVQTQYQRIDIYQTKTFGKLMVIDGCIMLTERDNFLYHEMMSHPILFTHPNPKRVAIIGGGDCGTLSQVLAHNSVEVAVQIEIDEAVTQLSKRFFPELYNGTHDTRAQLVFEDGISWLNRQAADTWDVFIIDSTDPVGHAKGLFEVEFLKQCCQCLKQDGLLVQQSESPLLHSHSIIRELHQSLHAAGFNQTHTLPFPQPVYPSGWWSATLASKNTNLKQFRELDARNKGFETLYYNAEIHQASLAQPEFMKQVLDLKQP